MCANFFPGRLEIISASTISILAPSMCQQTSVLVFDFIFRSARHCRFFMSVGCLLCCRFVSQKPSSRSPVIFPVFRSTVSACCCVCPLSSILFFVFCLSSNILLLCSFPLSLLCRLFFVVSANVRPRVRFHLPIRSSLSFLHVSGVPVMLSLR